MKKAKVVYHCTNCNHEAAKWMGQCGQCRQWNTFELYEVGSHKRVNSRESGNQAIKLIQLEEIEYTRDLSKISEFDRVLGGGIVPGSLILLGGGPGVGKSTLMTSVLAKLVASTGKSAFYASGEESINQIAGRIKRMNLAESELYLLNESDWQQIKSEIKRVRPGFLVIDSIQTTILGDLDSPPGSLSQIREVTYEIMNFVKAEGITCFIIGHITKEGSIAGPKVLEHMVDTVIYFEGDQFGHYRLLRSIKNRFGSTSEVGLFEMSGHGPVPVDNPSEYFLEENLEDRFGRSLTVILEGSRSLIVEIQGLVVENKFGNGRRTTQGLDGNRLNMLVAIMEKYFKLPLGLTDIYLNVVGGLKLGGRESDLAVLASLLSSFHGTPVDSEAVFLGEVGLTGEVRSIPMPELRLKDIVQLKYKRVITSYKLAEKYMKDYPLDLIGLKSVQELERLFK